MKNKMILISVKILALLIWLTLIILVQTNIIVYGPLTISLAVSAILILFYFFRNLDRNQEMSEKLKNLWLVLILLFPPILIYYVIRYE